MGDAAAESLTTGVQSWMWVGSGARGDRGEVLRVSRVEGSGAVLYIRKSDGGIGAGPAVGACATPGLGGLLEGYGSVGESCGTAS